MRILDAVRCISTALMLCGNDYMLFDDDLSMNKCRFDNISRCFVYYSACLFNMPAPQYITAFMSAIMLCDATFMLCYDDFMLFDDDSSVINAVLIISPVALHIMVHIYLYAGDPIITQHF
jgi:hypothetical protein